MSMLSGMMTTASPTATQKAALELVVSFGLAFGQFFIGSRSAALVSGARSNTP